MASVRQNRERYHEDLTGELWCRTNHHNNLKIVHFLDGKFNLCTRKQAFINYIFQYTKFCACLCIWEIIHVKEQTCTLLIITWYGNRNCTKLVLKPFAAKFSLSISVLCTVISCRLYISVYATTTIHLCALRDLCIYKAVPPFLINLDEKWCSKFNIVTMDHKLVPENSSSAAVYTLPNTIIYLKAVQYLNIRLIHQLNKTWT